MSKGTTHLLSKSCEGFYRTEKRRERESLQIAEQRYAVQGCDTTGDDSSTVAGYKNLLKEEIDRKN